MDKPLSPTIAKLRSFKSRPERHKSGGDNSAKLSKAIANRFCDLISESDKSVQQILAENPDLPSFKRLYNFQQYYPWFADMWKAARIKQTHFFAQKCIELYNSADPKTAHVIRIKFDILKWYCAKFNPDTFAEKPASAPVQTVNVGFNISPERLNDLRAKLDCSRTAFPSQNRAPGLPPKHLVAPLEPVEHAANGSEHSKRNTTSQTEGNTPNGM